MGLLSTEIPPTKYASGRASTTRIRFRSHASSIRSGRPDSSITRRWNRRFPIVCRFQKPPSSTKKSPVRQASAAAPAHACRSLRPSGGAGASGCVILRRQGGQASSSFSSATHSRENASPQRVIESGMPSGTPIELRRFTVRKSSIDGLVLCFWRHIQVHCRG